MEVAKKIWRHEIKSTIIIANSHHHLIYFFVSIFFFHLTLVFPQTLTAGTCIQLWLIPTSFALITPKTARRIFIYLNHLNAWKSLCYLPFSVPGILMNVKIYVANSSHYSWVGKLIGRLPAACGIDTPTPKCLDISVLFLHFAARQWRKMQEQHGKDQAVQFPHQISGSRGVVAWNL